MSALTQQIYATVTQSLIDNDEVYDVDLVIDWETATTGTIVIRLYDEAYNTVSLVMYAIDAYITSRKAPATFYEPESDDEVEITSEYFPEWLWQWLNTHYDLEYRLEEAYWDFIENTGDY